MLKKIFSILCMATMLLVVVNNSASAEGEPKIVVVFESPTGAFSEPEKVHTLLQDTLKNILDNMTCEIVPISETENYVQIYREENNLIASNGAEEGDATTFYLKKDDLNKICQYFSGDYLIYTRITNTAPKVYVGFFNASQKVSVVLDFRVWSDNKKDFSYMKRATATGKSTSILDGIGSSARALEKGLRKDLQEIEKDKNKIREALTE